MNKFNIDFYKNKNKFFALSITLLLIGLICNIIFGAKLDIQFAGGAVIKYSVSADVDTNKIASVVKDATGREATVSTSTLISDNSKQISIAFSGNEALSLDEQTAIQQALEDNFSDVTFSLNESTSVDPTMGAKFFQKCLVCFLITVVFLLLYVALRFKKIGGFVAGLTAIIALIHDCLIAYFVFIVFRMNINDIFIAVILTILGYSLNDTIVIYDRIRENNRLMGSKADPREVMNRSLNSVLSRTIYTSLTTFMALFVVFLVSVFYGLDSVKTFSLPMMAGVICGCYSSLFIAAPLFTMWEVHKRNLKAVPAVAASSQNNTNVISAEVATSDSDTTTDNSKPSADKQNKANTNPSATRKKSYGKKKKKKN